LNKSRRSRRPKVEQPSRAEREAIIKARAEAQAKAREEKLEREADEYEADKARAAEQAAGVHPVAAILPMMSDQELDALAADIAKNGQHEPIIYDADGLLVDGRCRLEACRRAGITPKTITLQPGEDAIQVSISNNIVRGNLNLSQRAMAVAALRPEESLSELVADSGFSKATMFEAVYVRDHNPSLISLIVGGTTHLKEAYDRTKEGIDLAKKRSEALAMLQEEALDLAEAIRDERMNLSQALREFQARIDKQEALKKAEHAFRNAEKKLKELREA
jgi:ParB-like nuclease domain